GADALPVLIELIQIQDQGDWEAGEIRRTAAELVGRLGPQGQSAVPALVASLRDPDRHFRAAAAAALGQVGGQNPQACAALVDLLKTDSRLSALRALSRIGPAGPTAIPDLIDLLHDPDAEV